MESPQQKRPIGIVLISLALLLSAIALLARTILLHKGGMAGLSRMVAVLVLSVLAVGLWQLRNGIRQLFFFLVVCDALSNLTALFLYALRQAHYRLAIELVVQVLIAAFLIWYLQSAVVQRAFSGASAWPATVQALVLTIFTVLLAFPFFWMGIASFKQNVDLYNTDNNPFLFNLPPTLDHLRFLFKGSDFGLIVLVVEFCLAALLIWAVWKLKPIRPTVAVLLIVTLVGSYFALRHNGYRPDLFAVLHLCIAVLFGFYLWGLDARVRGFLLTALSIDVIVSAVELFIYVLERNGFVRWLGNTTLVGIIVVGITLLLSLPAAYALARLTGKWGEGLGIGIFLTYLIPPTLLFIPLSRVVASLGLQDTIWSLVLVYPSITVPFSIWLLMGFFKSIPRELEDAAMVDGLTRFGAFLKLVIPISLSGILTVVIFTFTLVTQEFIYALTFISPDSEQMVGVGVPIFLVRGDVYYWGALMAACLITSIPIAFLYNLFLDRFIAGFTVGAVKG